MRADNRELCRSNAKMAKSVVSLVMKVLEVAGPKDESSSEEDDDKKGAVRASVPAPLCLL